MSIQGLGESQIEAIIDVRFGDDDAETWKPEARDDLLARWEKIKKDKHGQHYNNQGKHFSPFVLSVDGMMGKEAQVVIATLIQLMSAKMDELISQVKGWVNDRIEIAVVRSYYQVLRGAQVPSPLRTREPD